MSRLPTRWIPAASVLVVATVLLGTEPPRQGPMKADSSSGAACPLGHPGEGHDHEHALPSDREGAPWAGLEEVDLTQAFYFRPERGETAELRYRLREPARVLIRVRDADTRELYLATILNWERRQPGEHTEIWDGRDDAGQVIDMSEATITLIAEKADHPQPTLDLEARTPEEVVHAEEEHRHGTHHAWAEEVPALRVLEPAPGTEAGDLLLIRSAVDKDRRGYGNVYGYGVRYYVDGVLIREEYYKPESDGQFAYRLDTTAFADGEHLLRVGMCDHHEHATSASVPVIFRNAR